MTRSRVRIRFRKQGDLRLISHRDLARTWERLLRRAGVRLKMSEGFHPHPRIGFPSALPLGMAGLDEVVEIELAEDADAADLRARLDATVPEGLSIVTIEPLAADAKKAAVRSADYELPIPFERQADVAQHVAKFAAAAALPVDRGDGQPPVDLCRDLERIDLADGVLRFRLRVPHQRAARPRDVLAALGLDEHEGGLLTRTHVELEG